VFDRFVVVFVFVVFIVRAFGARVSDDAQISNGTAQDDGNDFTDCEFVVLRVGCKRRPVRVAVCQKFAEVVYKEARPHVGENAFDGPSVVTSVAERARVQSDPRRRGRVLRQNWRAAEHASLSPFDFALSRRSRATSTDAWRAKH